MLFLLSIAGYAGASIMLVAACWLYFLGTADSLLLEDGELRRLLRHPLTVLLPEPTPPPAMHALSASTFAKRNTSLATMTPKGAGASLRRQLSMSSGVLAKQPMPASAKKRGTQRQRSSSSSLEMQGESPDRSHDSLEQADTDPAPSSLDSPEPAAEAMAQQQQQHQQPPVADQVPKPRLAKPPALKQPGSSAPGSPSLSRSGTVQFTLPDADIAAEAQRAPRPCGQQHDTAGSNAAGAAEHQPAPAVHAAQPGPEAVHAQPAEQQDRAAAQAPAAPQREAAPAAAAAPPAQAPAREAASAQPQGAAALPAEHPASQASGAQRGAASQQQAGAAPQQPADAAEIQALTQLVMLLAEQNKGLQSAMTMLEQAVEGIKGQPQPAAEQPQPAAQQPQLAVPAAQTITAQVEGALQSSMAALVEQLAAELTRKQQQQQQVAVSGSMAAVQEQLTATSAPTLPAGLEQQAPAAEADQRQQPPAAADEQEPPLPQRSAVTAGDISALQGFSLQRAGRLGKRQAAHDLQRLQLMEERLHLTPSSASSRSSCGSLAVDLHSPSKRPISRGVSPAVSPARLHASLAGLRQLASPLQPSN